MAVIISDNVTGWFITDGIFRRAIGSGEEVNALAEAKVIVDNVVRGMPKHHVDAIPLVERGGVHANPAPPPPPPA